jgi:hypothetical protein
MAQWSDPIFHKIAEKAYNRLKTVQMTGFEREKMRL